MSRAQLSDIIRASLGAVSVGCVVDVGCGESDPFPASAVLEASGLEAMRFFGVDPLLSEHAPGFRGTLTEFIDLECLDRPIPDLVLCADALHCLAAGPAPFSRYLSSLHPGTPVLLWDFVQCEASTPESGPACTLHACKAMIDTELGISHGEMFTQADLLDTAHRMPVLWSVCAFVPGRRCSVAELTEACELTLDYAERIAGNRCLYTRVARTVRMIALKRDAAYRLEDRLLCIGTVAPESEKQHRQRNERHDG
ncbi:MAG: hypothetical protein ACLFNQ_00035 [Spirochaetaceae bacterium]